MPSRGFTAIAGRIGAGRRRCCATAAGVVDRNRGRFTGTATIVTDRLFFHLQQLYSAKSPLFAIRSGKYTAGARQAGELAKAMEIAVFARDVAAMPAGLEALRTEGVRLSGGNAAVAAADVCPPTGIARFDDLSHLDVED